MSGEHLTKTQMVETFQCPGCVVGSDTQCGHYKPYESCGSISCDSHVLGTRKIPGGLFALGLPKGFNKPGPTEDRKDSRHKISVRLYETSEDGPGARWDYLNVPVWALEQNGFLFVRTYCPRVNDTYVDVIQGGKLSDLPKTRGPIDVSAFLNNID